MSSNNPLILVLADSIMGHANQALGVAEKSGLPFVEVRTEFGIFSRIPNSIMGAHVYGLKGDSLKNVKAVLELRPDIVISAGRRTAPVARWIKRHNPHIKLVHIMNPQSGIRDFDLIACPYHDRLPSGYNIYRILLAPHRLNRADFPYPEQEKKISKIGVLLGGGTSKAGYLPDEIARFARMLIEMAALYDASLSITSSRRTGGKVEEVLDQALKGKINYDFYKYSPSRDNPYQNILKTSDALVVTGDSISMISEAIFTNKPVIIYCGFSALKNKHWIFSGQLMKEKLALPWALDEEVEFKFPAKHNMEQLDSALLIAGKINGILVTLHDKKKWGLRRY